MADRRELLALVIEDHDFQRQMVVEMLRELGIAEVLQAGDGRQGLDVMKRSAQIDLLVCDLEMPEMDGMEFIRHLGQAKNPASLIISSAKPRALMSSVEKMTRAYGVRLLGTIEKPVTMEGLENLLAQYKQQSAQPDARPAAAPAAFSLDEIVNGVTQKQFEPFFQPKLALSSGLLSGAEALARWRHPDRGIVSPFAFIGILETAGKIDDLTFLMLEKSADACRRWRESGHDLSVSVNLSLASLADTTLAERVTGIVRDKGLDPAHMVLEITESAAMTDVAPALENLTRLRMRGFGLSIDDYGTGFSSMQQLTRIPFSELKIDQSFVSACASSPSSCAIVESSMEIAQRLNSKFVGEGIGFQDESNYRTIAMS